MNILAHDIAVTNGHGMDKNFTYHEAWWYMRVESLNEVMIHYSHAPHTDVSVNDWAHIRRWSHKTIIL